MKKCIATEEVVCPSRNITSHSLTSSSYRLLVCSLKNRDVGMGFCVGRDSAVGIASLYGLEVPESNPGEGNIFRTRPDRPWGQHNRLYNEYRVVPGGKASGRGVNHPP